MNSQGHDSNADTILKMADRLIATNEALVGIVSQLNDRLMAKSLPEYSQFCDIKANFPELFMHTQELISLLRARQAFESRRSGADNPSPQDPVMPPIADDGINVRSL